MGALKMKFLLSITVMMLISSTTTQAEPSSEVAWTLETLAIMRSASPERGAEVAAEHCENCHGETGVNEDDEYPNIAGQLPSYSYKQLKDIQSNKRKSRKMRRRIKDLTDQDFMDLALFYADQAPMRRAPEAPSHVLVKKGDATRMLTACSLCHTFFRKQ